MDFIALPGQIYIFLTCVCIFYLKKRKTKTTKIYNISGNRTQKRTTKQNKRSQKHSPLPFPLRLLVLTGRCLDHGEGADGSRPLPKGDPSLHMLVENSTFQAWT